MEINFYQCDESLVKSIAPLMLRILEENKKALIFSRDAAQTKEIDDGLWSYGKNKFIPHVLISDKNFVMERQPILISNKDENANKADYLVLSEEVSPNFLSNFSRIFYFYDVLNIDNAKKAAANYKKVASKFNSYKKEDGKWIKANF